MCAYARKSRGYPRTIDDSQSSLDLDTRSGYSSLNYFQDPPRIGFENTTAPFLREMASSGYQNDLMKALSLCKPSDVIENKALLECFRQFIRRGTILKWCRILPEAFGARDVFKSIERLRMPIRATDVTTPQPHQPHQPNQPRDTLESPHDQYFENFVSDRKRLARLSRIAQRITSPQITTQAKAIYQRIEQLMDQNNTFYRQNIVLFGDAVDRYAAAPLVQLSKGRDRKTAAFKTIAEELEIPTTKVSKVYTHSRIYLRFADIGGPGSLRSIDGLKWDMENTNEEDVKLLCDYRKDRLPIVEELSQALNLIVIEYFVRNLLAQGVEAAEIAKGRTPLTKSICRHVDIDKFIQDGMPLPPSTSICNNEQPWHIFAQSPARPRSGIDITPPSHTISSDPQGLVSFYHALPSHKLYRAAETRTSTAKRRRVSGNEGLQTLTESDSMQENEQTYLTPRSKAPQFAAVIRTFNKGDHQTEETPNTFQSLEHGNKDYLETAAVELRQQPSSSYISSFQDEQSSYTFRGLEYEPGSSSTTPNGVSDQFCPSENGDAMGEASSAPNSSDIREEEDKDDSELPSVVVKDLRIGEQRLGDLDLFTFY